MNHLIQHASIVLPDQILQADLRIESGKIVEIGKDLQPRANESRIDAYGQYLLPGFIDIHNHGAQGFDCSLGRYRVADNTFDLSETAFQEGLAEALEFYHSQGVTRVLPTSLAASVEDLLFSFQQIDACLHRSGCLTGTPRESV